MTSCARRLLQCGRPLYLTIAHSVFLVTTVSEIRIELPTPPISDNSLQCHHEPQKRDFKLQRLHPADMIGVLLACNCEGNKLKSVVLSECVHCRDATSRCDAVSVAFHKSNSHRSALSRHHQRLPKLRQPQASHPSSTNSRCK